MARAFVLSRHAPSDLLAHDLIQLLEVRFQSGAGQRTGFVVVHQCMQLARKCGISKVFFDLEDARIKAHRHDFRVEVVTVTQYA